MSEKKDEGQNVSLAELFKLLTEYLRLQCELTSQRIEDYSEWGIPCECDDCGGPLLPSKSDEEVDEPTFPDGFEEEWS
jgi:hypothetical protein